MKLRVAYNNRVLSYPQHSLYIYRERESERKLDVWMDGWTDGWMDGWMDG